MEPKRALVSAAFVLAATVGSQACADSIVAREAVEEIDSAGVRVITNHRPVSPVAWSVGNEPAVEIGGNEDDSTQVLFRVEGAFVLSDGRIVIGHVPPPMIRWYDRTGAFLLGTGRPGGGPGEFGSGEGARISMVWPLAADSLGTWEHNPRRMQVFDPNGAFARAVTLEIPPTGAYPQMLGPVDDGFVVFVISAPIPGVVGEVTRDRIPYLRYRRDGSYAREIGRFPGPTSFTFVARLPDGSQQRTRGRPPFAALPVAWPSRDRLIYGSGDSFELAVYDTSGSLATLIRRPDQPPAVTAELIETYKVETMARAPADPAIRRQWQEDLDNAPYPRTFPAYRRIRADRTGMLWAQEYNLPGAESVSWSVFDRSGRWISDVRVPAHWQVLDIGEDYLLVLVRNELDVELVRRYPLQRY